MRVSAAATGSEFGATKGRVPELEIRAGLDDGLRSLCVRWPLADFGRVREWPLAGWLLAAAVTELYEELRVPCHTKRGSWHVDSLPRAAAAVDPAQAQTTSYRCSRLPVVTMHPRRRNAVSTGSTTHVTDICVIVSCMHCSAGSL